MPAPSDEHERRRWPRWSCPATIFLFALALRAIYLFELRASPLLEFPVGDALAYDQWAQRIAGGDWLGREVFYQAPLYPYFMAGVYALAGKSLLTVRVVQSLLGAGACVLLWSAGCRLFSRRVGLIAGLSLAVYPTAIFSDGLIQKSSLDNFFTCLLIALLARVAGAAPEEAGKPEATSRWGYGRAWLGIGVVTGALALTRENALALAPVLLIAAAVGLRPQADRAFAGRALRVGMLLLGLALVLAPVAARNRAVGGQWHLTTSQFGPNFYIGNHAGASGSYMPLAPGRGTAAFERIDATRLAQVSEGRSLSPAEVSRHWFGRSLEFIRDQPGQWLRLMGRKALLFLNRLELVDTDSQVIYARSSVLLAVSDGLLGFGPLVCLAAGGAVLLRGQWRRLWVFHAIVLVYAYSVVLFYVVARYRFPVVPFLLLPAAAGAVEAARLFRERRLKALVGPLAAAVVALGAASVPVVSADEELAYGEYNLGKLLLDHRADPDEAAPHLSEAVRLSPGFVEALDALGVALARTGRHEDALRCLNHALRLNPAYTQARFHLAYSLGAVGNHDLAIAEFEQVLREDPEDAATHLNLGALLASVGRLTEAVVHDREAIRLDPASDDAINNLGIALGRQGKFNEALAAFERALKIRDNNPETLCNYGLTLAQVGRRDEALRHLTRAAELRPDDPAIRESLERVRFAGERK